MKESSVPLIQKMSQPRCVGDAAPLPCGAPTPSQSKRRDTLRAGLAAMRPIRHVDSSNPSLQLTVEQRLRQQQMIGSEYSPDIPPQLRVGILILPALSGSVRRIRRAGGADPPSVWTRFLWKSAQSDDVQIFDAFDDVEIVERVAIDAAMHRWT